MENLHQASLEQLARAVERADSTALCCHVKPDGDTLGSALALMWALEGLGRRAQVFCEDEPPSLLHALPGWERVSKPDKAEGQAFSLCLVVDAGSPDRLGTCAALLERADVAAQMDHHRTNTGYGMINVVDPEASATAVLALKLLRRLGAPITREAAMCLYAALATDTCNFSSAGVNAEAFDMAADLMRAGLPLPEMNRALFHSHSKERMALLSRALASLRPGGQTACMRLTPRDFAETGGREEYLVGMVDYAMDVEGVCLAALVYQLSPNGECGVSLRAQGAYSAADVAVSLGGGGHRHAAGCALQGSLDECVSRVCSAMAAALARE